VVGMVTWNNRKLALKVLLITFNSPRKMLGNSNYDVDANIED